MSITFMVIYLSGHQQQTGAKTMSKKKATLGELKHQATTGKMLSQAVPTWYKWLLRIVIDFREERYFKNIENDSWLIHGYLSGLFMADIINDSERDILENLRLNVKCYALMNVYNDGFDAYPSKKLEDNPYYQYSYEFNKWKEGWNFAHSLPF